MFIIHGKPNCPGCEKAKQLLEAENIPYTYKEVGKDISLEDFYMIAPSSHRSVPMISDGDTYIGGLNQLEVLLAYNATFVKENK